jgi:hypothetical protein
VGSTVTNAGFGVGGYNVTQVVTASTATYYELTIAYSANSSGTGTYYSYQQDNEVAKAITAIASVANGIQCTCVAHGYAVGDAVLIVGTIDYNGSWLISAVATDTFNIVSQYSDIDRVVALTFTSSQTGTVSRGDKNLAGLATLSGVSVVYYTIGSALETRAVYTLPAGSIFTFNGVCNWNPRYEEFIIPNSGQITVDFRITFAGFIKIGSYTKGVLRISGAYDVGFRLYETVQNSYNYSVRTTGTVWLMGGVYHLPGGGWD